MIPNPFALSAQEILARLKSDLETGLDKQQVRHRLEKYGANQIPLEGPKKRWRILADQLVDPIIYILTAAAILAFTFSDWLEAVAILIVILISIGIGFFMELQAIRSLEALRKLGQVKTLTLRSGQTIPIKASQLVLGDVILVQTGDVITADARLVWQDTLSTKESTLTGESFPVAKKTGLLSIDTQIPDQSNMLFKGTLVTSGSGKAIVVATGTHTELGKIQLMGMNTLARRTPLEKKLNQLSKWLIWLTLAFTVLIVIAGYIRGKDLFFMIETGVALAVAAIPEGLLIVATIALAQGMMRLSKKQIIIKNLEAVQTLGATNIICTDKTGTLTEDKMVVHSMVFKGTSISNIDLKHPKDFDFIKDNAVFDKMMLASILCNNVKITSERLKGDSIEEALIDFAIRTGYDPLIIRSENREVMELPFDPERKMMVSVNQNDTGLCLYIKGALENVIVDCDTILEDGRVKSFEHKEKWYTVADDLALQGLRTLAFAFKDIAMLPEPKDLAQELTFLGVLGFIDPPRKDVKATIDTYKRAGIKVVMVTGDHPKTAQHVAQEVGLLGPDVPIGKVLTGMDLRSIPDVIGKTTTKLLDASVFARVTPQQKLDLVSFYQRNGNLVGMIGDGINDVPALKKADIGIAMGIRGTEAAREAADVILKNDRFTAIELAIRQGRVVFQNIRQFVVYLLSCNLAEILSVGIAALMNLPSPLLPLQILFLNLVTDVFPALALGLGKGDSDIMEQPPLDSKEPIMTQKYWGATIIYGLSISAAVLGIVIYATYVLGLKPDIVNNMAFYTLVLAQLFNVFNMPKRVSSFFYNEVTKNGWVWGAIVLSLVITLAAYLLPPVARALELKALTFNLFGLTLLFALGSLVLAQAIKRAGGTL